MVLYPKKGAVYFDSEIPMHIVLLNSAFFIFYFLLLLMDFDCIGSVAVIRMGAEL